MLPKQAVSFEQLRSEGRTKKEILALCSSLKLFPTPFKGIYYVPLEEERKGGFIEKPNHAFIQAVSIFLGTRQFYFSCQSAQEVLGISWQHLGIIHIVNTKLSRKIDLGIRISRNEKKGTYRAKRIARILSEYGNKIIFHKGSIAKAKIKQTPYGAFALKSQIKKDMLRFREKI